MKKTIIVCGYGPGISDAVARKFGGEDFSVALVARSKAKLEAAEAALTASGVNAKAFPCDLSDLAAVKTLVQDVRKALGPITVVHWNAYAGLAGDLMTANPAELQKVFDVGVTGLVAAVQEALPDLKAHPEAAVLVTGGGFALYDRKVDELVVSWNTMGLAVAKSAQHKLVGLLHARLAPDGIYVGEIVVLGAVKGTAFDPGSATLAPATVAAKFWEIYTGRTELSVNVS
jgi:NAD(P)-dependent dehydrogenase (short-subunit alcohol dehydrogenase family)